MGFVKSIANGIHTINKAIDDGQKSKLQRIRERTEVAKAKLELEKFEAEINNLKKENGRAGGFLGGFMQGSIAGEMPSFLKEHEKEDRR